MVNIRDSLGLTNKKEPEGILVEIDMNCEKCNSQIGKLYYNKDTKEVTICCDNHEDYTMAMDLSWLML